MASVPSTLNNTTNEGGIAAALNGLLETGIQFLGQNLFGGDEADAQAVRRKAKAGNAQAKAAIGIGLNAPTLIGAVAIGAAVFILIKIAR